MDSLIGLIFFMDSRKKDINNYYIIDIDIRKSESNILHYTPYITTGNLYVLYSWAKKHTKEGPKLKTPIKTRGFI